MSNDHHDDYEDPLDAELAGMIGAAINPVVLSDGQVDTIKQRVLHRIRAQQVAPIGLFTLRANEGEWIAIAPKLEKKVLFEDKIQGIEAYLIRAQPGAHSPPHPHDKMETCLVLEGQLEYDDLVLYPGDFHVANKGAHHGAARTRTGALLYIQVG